MWANAQRDGRPAEYRWRPLFNAAVWLTPTTTVPCTNAAKQRNPLKFAGVPQSPEPIPASPRNRHHSQPPQWDMLIGNCGTSYLNLFHPLCTLASTAASASTLSMSRRQQNIMTNSRLAPSPISILVLSILGGWAMHPLHTKDFLTLIMLPIYHYTSFLCTHCWLLLHCTNCQKWTASTLLTVPIMAEVLVDTYFYQHLCHKHHMAILQDSVLFCSFLH